jgi:hypothetical protein
MDKPRMIEQTPFQNKNLIEKLEAGENSTFWGYYKSIIRRRRRQLTRAISHASEG